MAEIFDKMKVEFVDQDESVQVIADNIRDTGEVPERYVKVCQCRRKSPAGRRNAPA
jgi:hypothetical protein